MACDERSAAAVPVPASTDAPRNPSMPGTFFPPGPAPLVAGYGTGRDAVPQPA
jgi:hypothetical protein